MIETNALSVVGAADLSVRLVGQTGQPIKVPVKKGFGDWLSRLANDAQRAFRFVVVGSIAAGEGKGHFELGDLRSVGHAAFGKPRTAGTAQVVSPAYIMYSNSRIQRCEFVFVHQGGRVAN